VLLAINPRARKGPAAAAALRAALIARGHTVLDVPLERDTTFAEALGERRAEIDVAVVGGGDGTLLRVLPALVETKVPVVIVPLGTFNELARTLGMPSDPDQVAALVDQGVPLMLDVGRVNDAYYLNEASVGLSTRVAELQTPPLKRALGLFAIPVATARALRWWRPMHLEIEDDQGKSRTVRVVQLTVANSYRFGGVVENPDASLEDGQLWLYALDVRGWWDALRIVLAVAVHRFPRAPRVETLRGTRFRVRSLRRQRHHVYADSEKVAQLPAEFRVMPHALTVLVPSARVPAIR
jgi:diacylglycerol kinase family enzyme